MGIELLQSFIEAQAPAACVPVDLLEVARGVAKRRSGAGAPAAPQLCLVVDAESCLHRLYGGHVSDWVCGGQWARMVHFLTVLVQCSRANNLELAVFFSGALEPLRMREWVARQCTQRDAVNNALQHATVRHTPPPKGWWTPPGCLRTALRMALHQLAVQVRFSVDDHRREVMAFCRDNNCHGVLADHAEYVVFNPLRLFSGSQLKLTLEDTLNTKEVVLKEVARELDLKPSRLLLLGALLGTHLLTDQDLRDFHQQLCSWAGDGTKLASYGMLRLVAQFVRALPSTDCLDTIGAQVFKSASDPRVEKLKQSVDYLASGASSSPPKPSCDAAPDADPVDQLGPAERLLLGITGRFQRLSTHDVTPPPTASGSCNGVSPSVNGHMDTVSHECRRPLFSATHVYERRMSGAGRAATTATHLCWSAAGSCREALPRSDEPLVHQVLTKGELKISVSMEEEWNCYVPNAARFFRPVRERVYGVLFDIHHRGMVDSTVFDIHHRGMVDSTVFDIHRREMADNADGQKADGQKADGQKADGQKADGQKPDDQKADGQTANGQKADGQKPDGQKADGQKADYSCNPGPPPQVLEWVYTHQNPYTRPDLVSARSLGWPVPTVQRLWFSTSDDGQKHRLRAFLTCMRSDCASMRSPLYVPPHLLILACVLRFIMSQTRGDGQSLLHRPELDAFLAQALALQTDDARRVQKTRLTSVLPRGILLANLFMQGVETALFANDACGTPVPWSLCYPWLYFDGKLFQSYLVKTGHCSNVTQLCDNQPEMSGQLELTRQAVLDGLHVQYGRPPLAGPQLSAAAGGVQPPPGRHHGQPHVSAAAVGSWAARTGTGAGGVGLFPAGLRRGPRILPAHLLPRRKYALPRSPWTWKLKGKEGAFDLPPLQSTLVVGRGMTVDTSEPMEVGSVKLCPTADVTADQAQDAA